MTNSTKYTCYFYLNNLIFMIEKNMDLSKIGNFIAKSRKEKGLTQKELADKLNLSEKTISKW